MLFNLLVWLSFITPLLCNTIILKPFKFLLSNKFHPLSFPPLPLIPPLGLSSPQKWVRLQPLWDLAPWAWAPAIAPSSLCSTCQTTARTSTSPAAQPPSLPTPSSSRPRPSRPPSRHCPRPRPRPSRSPPRPPRLLPPRRSPQRRRRSRSGQVEEW